jgi:pimeloyl-[acyl-carrier protein] methyl ester esterase
MPEKNVMQTGLRLLYSNDLSAEISTCSVPTLFVGGTRDRTIRPESFNRGASLMPAAGCSLIRTAGHAPFISHPDRFLDIIRGFLNGDKTA